MNITRAELDAIKQTLATLIAWLPQSANAPIRVDEAQRLLAMLEGSEPMTKRKT